MMEAYSVPTICFPISNQSIKVALEEYPHLSNLNLADSSTLSGDSDVEVDKSIRADYYWKFVTGTIRRGDKPGPVAVLTRLGWVLSGPVIQEHPGTPTCTTNLNTTHVLRIDAEPVLPSPTDHLQKQLEKFWDLETLGIQKTELSAESKFMEEIILWIQTTLSRRAPATTWQPYQFCATSKFLDISTKTNTNLLQEYDNIVGDQTKSGVIESANDVFVHYLPHREVREDENTTKVRVVYDASAKGHGTSLNDCLHHNSAYIK